MRTNGQIRESVSSKYEHLLSFTYEFLLDNQHINFGVSLSFTSQLPKVTRGIVVVIGAGLAKLAAMRQLLSFGCKVVVLEGRNRPVRRVYTQKMGNEGKFVVLGLGWSVLTGFLANPVAILLRQLSTSLHKFRVNFPLYQPNGEPVYKEKDSKLPVIFLVYITLSSNLLVKKQIQVLNLY